MAQAGTDYRPLSGTLTFSPGQTELEVAPQIIDNLLPQADRTLTVALSAVQNAHAGRMQASGTIHDNEPQVQIKDAQADEHAGSIAFELQLNNAASQAVTVYFTTQDATAQAGVDFVATASSVTIRAGQTSNWIQVPLLDDSVYEGDEVFTVILTGADGASITDNAATGQIRENDAQSSGGGAGPGGNGGSASLEYRDEFASLSYAGNDGAQNWKGPWEELGENNGETRGKTRVVSSSSCAAGYCARFNPRRGAGDGLSRAADLGGASTATLTLYYRTSSYSGADARLEVSSGSGWTTLHTFGDGSASGTLTFDISRFASSNTQIRIRQVGNGSGGWLFLDDVAIMAN